MNERKMNKLWPKIHLTKLISTMIRTSQSLRRLVQHVKKLNSKSRSVISFRSREIASDQTLAVTPCAKGPRQPRYIRALPLRRRVKQLRDFCIANVRGWSIRAGPLPSSGCPIAGGAQNQSVCTRISVVARCAVRMQRTHTRVCTYTGRISV